MIMKQFNLPLVILIVLFQYQISFAQQPTGTSVTICWDSSLSMEDRNLEEEFSFLEDYFTLHPKAGVTVLLFSNTIVGREKFQVSEGRWGLVKEMLSAVLYDGATSYDGLSELTGSSDVLLFTDGHQNTKLASPYFQGRLFVINSKADFNPANLNLLTILNEGDLVNLTENKKRTNTSLKKYFGVIQGDQIINRRVEIGLKGRTDETIRPDEDGSYELNAEEGDIMIITTAGGRRIEKELGDNLNIDIWLLDTGEIKLEEVVVTGIQEEVVEQKITANGPKNADAVGYAVQSITDEDIADISVTVNNATQGKFSGVTLGQNDDLSQVILRPSNSILSTNYGLIVVDGVPLRRSDSSTGEIQSTDFINPQNIANMTVLKGLAATNRFGSMGANGVILITTKTATVDGVPGKKKDLALLTDNIYDGKLKVAAKTLVTPYLKALKKAKNLEEAYNIYLVQRKQYADAPAFYIDVFDYFYPSSKPLAERVLSNVLELDNANYSTLRAMLFKAQLYQMNQLELETASSLIDKFPQKIQSYFDLAMAYKANGNYQTCLDQLLKIADGSANTTLDFSGLKKSARTEIKNLVYLKGRELDLSGLDPEYRKNLTYNARVIIEWSHASAEFELQFVNPQKRFFTWEHTGLTNAQRLRDEVEHGYSREEFEIVGQETVGEWLINVKYLGNLNTSDETPAFLRCRVQTSFGKTGQQEEIFAIRLHEKDSEEQLLSLKVQ